jgi:putative PIN family toxin of toxin-antitoxin system
MRVVLDTNIIVGAMLREGGATRAVLRLCLQGDVRPVIGVALFAEMEDVLSRQDLFQASPLNAAERGELFAALLSVAVWVPIYYTWRPNLPDEADNHIVDLAVAGSADYIVTQNVRDFTNMELQFPQLKQATAAEFLDIWRKR